MILGFLVHIKTKFECILHMNTYNTLIQQNLQTNFL